MLPNTAPGKSGGEWGSSWCSHCYRQQLLERLSWSASNASQLPVGKSWDGVGVPLNGPETSLLLQGMAVEAHQWAPWSFVAGLSSSEALLSRRGCCCRQISLYYVQLKKETQLASQHSAKTGTMTAAGCWKWFSSMHFATYRWIFLPFLVRVDIFHQKTLRVWYELEINSSAWWGMHVAGSFLKVTSGPNQMPLKMMMIWWGLEKEW